MDVPKNRPSGKFFRGPRTGPRYVGPCRLRALVSASCQVCGRRVATWLPALRGCVAVQVTMLSASPCPNAQGIMQWIFNTVPAARKKEFRAEMIKVGLSSQSDEKGVGTIVAPSACATAYFAQGACESLPTPSSLPAPRRRPSSHLPSAVLSCSLLSCLMVSY